jgi:hypothetical protein
VSVSLLPTGYHRADSKPQPDGTLVKALHNPANEAVECETMGPPPGP